MRIILFLLLTIQSYNLAAAESSPITCMTNNEGYLPYNHKTEVWIGTSSFIEKKKCDRLLGTFTTVGQTNVICSSIDHGYTVYESDTGEILNGRNYQFWNNLSTCQRAIAAQNNGLICAPRGNGSGVYDVNNGYFIGDGIYYYIEDCAIATSYSKPDLVCALIQDGSSRIYNRNFNVPWSVEIFNTVLECGQANNQ